ncbi:MAG: hypothetical protein SGARI_000611 [Bacillariaceae sp.]
MLKAMRGQVKDMKSGPPRKVTRYCFAEKFQINSDHFNPNSKHPELDIESFYHGSKFIVRSVDEKGDPTDVEGIQYQALLVIKVCITGNDQDFGDEMKKVSNKFGKMGFQGANAMAVDSEDAPPIRRLRTILSTKPAASRTPAPDPPADEESDEESDEDEDESMGEENGNEDEGVAAKNDAPASTQQMPVATNKISTAEQPAAVPGTDKISTAEKPAAVPVTESDNNDPELNVVSKDSLAEENEDETETVVQPPAQNPIDQKIAAKSVTKRKFAITSGLSIKKRATNEKEQCESMVDEDGKVMFEKCRTSVVVNDDEDATATATTAAKAMPTRRSVRKSTSQYATSQYATNVFTPDVAPQDTVWEQDDGSNNSL